MKRIIVALATVLPPGFLVAGQQVPDTWYAPPIENPACARVQGPLIYTDKGHNNFHTRGDYNLPFARMNQNLGIISDLYGYYFQL